MSIWNAMLRAPVGGRSGYARGDTASTVHAHSDGSVTVTTHQDVSGVLRENKDLRNDDRYTGDFQEDKDSWGRRVAQIPVVVMNQWIHEGFDPMAPGAAAEVLQKLDDPDWEDLKVVDEKVARHAKRSYMKASSAPPRIIKPKGGLIGG